MGRRTPPARNESPLDMINRASLEFLVRFALTMGGLTLVVLLFFGVLIASCNT